MTKLALAAVTLDDLARLAEKVLRAVVLVGKFG